MTDWIIGKDDKATLDYIEQSWPAVLTPDLGPPRAGADAPPTPALPFTT